MHRAALPVLYKSPALVAVDKPAGLAVHRGQSHDAVHALELVRDQVGCYVYPVHRRDRGRSGVLVFARTKDAARAQSEAFEQGVVTKRYLALVRGVPPDEERIEHALSREDGGPAKPATTELRTLARYGRYALVEATPKTGRTHQIRRHLKHLSCPIIGDVRYGKGLHNRWFREHYALSRLALHAASLTLSDPTTLCTVTIQSPLPADLAAALARLESEAALGRANGPDAGATPRTE